MLKAIALAISASAVLLVGCAGAETEATIATSATTVLGTTSVPRSTTTQVETTTTSAATTSTAAVAASTSAPPASSTSLGVGEIVIANVLYDGPGNDVEFGDSEYVLLRNDGSGPVDVSRWSLRDEADHTITIPSGYVIEPGAELRVYSGPGDDTKTAYYEGLAQAIWNNSGGDTATLRDSSGNEVDSFSYSS